MPVFSEKTRTARKSHVCYNCRKAIDAGQSYTYLSGADHGYGWSGKTHTDCRQAEIGLNHQYKTDFHLDEWRDLATSYEDEGCDVLEWLEKNHPSVRARFPTTPRKDSQ